MEDVGPGSHKAEQHKVLWNMVPVAFLPFLASYISAGMAAAGSEIDDYFPLPLSRILWKGMDTSGERETAPGLGLPAPVFSGHALGEEAMKDKNDDLFYFTVSLKSLHIVHICLTRSQNNNNISSISDSRKWPSL